MRTIKMVIAVFSVIFLASLSYASEKTEKVSSKADIDTVLVDTINTVDLLARLKVEMEHVYVFDHASQRIKESSMPHQNNEIYNRLCAAQAEMKQWRDHVNAVYNSGNEQALQKLRDEIEQRRLTQRAAQRAQRGARRQQDNNRKKT